jgi:CRISPR-associated protein Cmr1
MDRIHETGILGSLRWWYEAIIRGLGGWACDPGTHGCLYDSKKPDNGLCDACHVFGATGWKRRFRLSISGEGELAWQGKHLNIKPPGRTRGWILKAGSVGELDLIFTGDPGSLERVHALLHFLAAWGSLGARPQLGYGVFGIIPSGLVPLPFTWQIDTHQDTGISDKYPDLRSFSFFKLRFTPGASAWWYKVPGLQSLLTRPDERKILESLAKKGLVPVAPTLKNHLRFEQKWSSNALPHWLFGTLHGNERSRSKVAFSWAYRVDNSDEWEIRGWFYLPQDNIGRSHIQEVRQVFRHCLEQPPGWFEALGLKAADYRAARVILPPNLKHWQFYTSREVRGILSDVLEKR